MAKREIFRSTALARMSSPEQLDQLLNVTTSKSWIALLAVMIILAVAIGWGFEGQIDTKAEGNGVAVHLGNVMTVGTLSQGQVVTLPVKAGDYVTSGQVIATIAQPSLIDRISRAEAQLADAITSQKMQSTVRSSGEKLELESLARQRATYQLQIQSLKVQGKTVADQIPVNEELFAKGLITRQQILSLKERQASIENQIASISPQLAQLNSSEFRLQNGGKQSDAEAQMRITDMRRNLQLLKNDLVLASKVESPYSGRVLEVQSAPGSLVGVGSTLFTVQSDEDQIEIVVFVPSSTVKEIKVGQEAQIIPSSVRVEEYGFIRGKISAVATYPATQSALMRLFQNDALVKIMASSGPVNEVRVQTLKNPATISGLEWSSKNGAPIQLTPATLCSVRVITRQQLPISMVLPYLKTKLGVE